MPKGQAVDPFGNISLTRHIPHCLSRQGIAGDVGAVGDFLQRDRVGAAISNALQQ
jgi:hypothetical protein